MAKIKSISAREILDSRGNPTVETMVVLDNDIFGVSSVPSGASIGKFEALELRDKDPKRFHGMGVQKAVSNVENLIAPALIYRNPEDQGLIDEIMINLDGTENKKKLGANSILSVSLAACKAAAKNQNLPLYQYINILIEKLGLRIEIKKIPTPTFDLISGGKHGAGNLDFQEFHLIPASSFTFSQALKIGVEIYHQLKQILKHRNAIYSVGDEGGFAPNLYTNLEALEIIIEATKEVHFHLGVDVFLGLDIAPSFFFKESYYQLKDRSEPLKTDKYIDFLLDLNRQFKLLALEDPLDEDDWNAWKKLNQKIGKKVIIIGDDLLVTNPKRLKKAIKENACSGILVKPNQIGTLTETLEVVKIAKQAGFNISISHRSGETNDTFIADLACGVQSDLVKFGAPARGERVVKYNRLLEIEEELRVNSKF